MRQEWKEANTSEFRALCTVHFWVESRDEDPTYFSTVPDPAQLRKKIRIRLRIRPEIEMKKKDIYILGR